MPILETTASASAYGFSPPRRLWTPDKLPSLHGWWDVGDVSTITQVSGAVSQLNDKSGAARHLIQPTAAYRPIYSAAGFNGRPSILFDGGDAHLSINAFPLGGTTASVSMVAAILSTRDWGRYLSFSGGANDYADAADMTIAHYDSQGTSIHARRGNYIIDLPTGTVVFATPLHIQLISTGSQLQLYKNNVLMGQVALSSAFRASGTLRVAATAAGAWQPGNIRLMEIVISTAALTADVRANLHGYLAKKWGIA